MRQTACKEPKEHHLHLCELKANPHNPELDKLFAKPQFVCTSCGGKANLARNLCDPKKL